MDNFMGVGSVGEASLQLGRQFIGFEIASNYFSQALKRLNRVERELTDYSFINESPSSQTLSDSA